MPFSDTFRDSILTTNFDTPTDLELGLFDDDPTGAGVEASGGSYARQVVQFGTVGAGTGSRRQVQNTNAPSFSASGGDWGSIAWIGVFTSGGSLLWFGELDQAEIINDGGTIEFAIGSIIIFMEDAP